MRVFSLLFGMGRNGGVWMFQEMTKIKGVAVVSFAALSLMIAGCGGQSSKTANDSSKVESTQDKKESSAESDYDKMVKEITTGWNTETTDSDTDSANWEKAIKLIKKYPDYLRQSEAYRAEPQSMMKKPWEFYGKVISIKGRIYSIEQRPPGDSVAKFFGRSCYHAMLRTPGEDSITFAVDIIDDADSLKEDQTVSLRGYIYGHVGLVNKTFGGKSKGIGFIGFLDNANSHMTSAPSSQATPAQQPPQSTGSSMAHAELDYHWFMDSRTGVLIWNPMPEDGETVTWDGGSIQDGAYRYAEGTGVSTWYLNGAFEQKDEGTYVHGYREGDFKQTMADGRVKYTKWRQGTRVD